MNSYLWVLFAHSYVRWLVIGLTPLVIARAGWGWVRGRAWTVADAQLHAVYVRIVDVQFTLGATLYVFLSPFVKVFYERPHALRDPLLRFFGLGGVAKYCDTSHFAPLFRQLSREKPRHSTTMPAFFAGDLTKNRRKLLGRNI